MSDLELISIMAVSLGVIVATVYYTLTLRNTNRTRQAELFMEIYDRYNDADMLERYMDVMDTEWKNAKEGYEKIINPRKYKSFWVVINFYEGIGVLVKEKLVNIRFVALLMAGTTRRFWEKLEPVVKKLREVRNYPRYASETEFLYNTLIKYMEQHHELKT